MSHQLIFLIHSLTFIRLYDAVFQGNHTDVIENSFFAQIYKRNELGEETFCSGALVEAEWVVTAGNCLAGNPITEVWTEASDIDASFQIHPHPKYQYLSGEVIRADIGLIKISTQSVSHNLSISLPGPREDIVFIENQEQPVNMMGKGSVDLSDPGKVHQFRVRKASFHTSLGRCYKRDRFYLAQGEFCSYSLPVHRFLSCKGDSGGPIFAHSPLTEKKVIIAIYSSGLHRCEQKEEALRMKTLQMYVRITAYMPWILHKIDALSPSHRQQGTMDGWMVHPFSPNLP